MATVTDSLPSLTTELNLGHYLALLRRRWFLLLIGAVLGAIAAYTYVSLRPLMYSSEADVAIVRAGTVVNLNPQFRTVSDTDPNSQSLDQLSRRASLTALGESPAFASEVIQQMGDQLPEYFRSPDIMRRAVSVDATGDLIRINALTDSPQVSAAIAAAWSQAYVDRVNQIFSENPITPDSYAAQVVQARTDYTAKQKALEDFLANNQIEKLKRDQDLLSRQLNSQVDLETKLIQLEKDMQALRALVAAGQGDASTGDELSRLLLQANLFNNSGSLPLQLDLPLGELRTTTTRDQQVAQLDALLKTIADRRAAFGGDAQKQLYTQLGAVQSQLEHAQASNKDLQSQRDLAWNLYQLLQTKIGETTVSEGTAGQTVRIANVAVVPSEPLETRRTLTTVLGALAGLIVGAAIALFVRAN